MIGTDAVFERADKNLLKSVEAVEYSDHMGMIRAEDAPRRRAQLT